MKLNICVAIQVKSGVIEEIVKIIKKALNKDADLIELRFDYIDNIQNISQGFAERLLSTIKPDALAIFTLRDVTEGGKIQLDEISRLELIKELINAQPDYLDIEMSTVGHILKDIITLATQKKVKLIFSYHDFDKTPSLNKAIEIINDFKNKIKDELSMNFDIVKRNIIKLIFTANNFEDNLVPLNLIKKVSKDDQNIISFSMGESGMLSRFLCVNVGSFLTFASIEETTAPGQVHIEKMREIHRLLFSQ